jgi:hypothetical protein
MDIAYVDRISVSMKFMNINKFRYGIPPYTGTLQALARSQFVDVRQAKPDCLRTE